MATPESSDQFIEAFAQAAAAGSVLELKYRMLAEMRPRLRPFARAQRLEDVETAIVEEYRGDLTDKEIALLGDTRAPSKIVHCEFGVAHEKLRAMGTKLVDGLVSVGNLATGEMTPLTVGEKGFVFGWLIQSSGNGLFAQARKRFNTARDVVDRLLALG